MTSWIMLNTTTNSNLTNNVSTEYQLDNGNVGLVTSGDSQIAQGAIGDTSLLQTWQANAAAVVAIVAAPAADADPVPPTGLPIAQAAPTIGPLGLMDLNESQIADAISHNMLVGMFAGGWAL
jgi:hypothetical protein